jgi:hypothetical protein
MRASWLVLSVACAGCGHSPTSPTPPPPIQPQTQTGTVMATNGGQPLAGLTIDGPSGTTTTDSAGRYTLTLPNASPLLLTLHGPQILTRRGLWTSPDLEAFAIGSDFDPSYYRALAHDGADHPDRLSPIRRWTRNPNFYIRTLDDQGRPVAAQAVAEVQALLPVVTPAFTGQRIGAASVSSGPETHQGEPGWVTVTWNSQPVDYCGTADVGLEGGILELTTAVQGCSCPGHLIRPRTIKHELGHVLGLWHTQRHDDLMSGLPTSACDHDVTAREQQYADYLYRRPVGNTDPDTDPSSTPSLTPTRVR